MPKYLLELGDQQTILERSIEEFNFDDQVNLYVVINEDHRAYAGQIEGILSKTTDNYEVIVTGDTRGQAETGLIGCSKIDNDYPVFFFNGDTILKNRDIQGMSADMGQHFSGAIDVFIEDRNHFSFVKLSEDRLVEEIAEKVPISRFATTGLYGFSNKDLFVRFFDRINTSSEMYISDLYKLMLEDQEKIKGYVYEDGMDTIILGTPEEYFSNRDKL